MATALHLTGGRVLGPDGRFSLADIALAEGRIVEAPAATALSIDCSGYHLLPGIVDIHGDAFEHELQPRRGVEIALPVALGSIDRQLLANGITTAFHGVSASWEPGARSLEASGAFLEGLAAQRLRLLSDHRVQLRWEIYALDAVEAVLGWLAGSPLAALAFNDHATPAIACAEAGQEAKLARWAERAGVTLKQYLAVVEAALRRQPELPEAIARVAAEARRRGAVLLAHDEAKVGDRAANRALGMGISEFPLSAAVAADAVAKGEQVVMGGPNVLRGGSHKGFLSAEEAIAEGLCTILASDYYYPSLLHAAERLVSRGVRSLAEAWPLISQSPAAAMGLDDRGSLAVGRRADLVVLDCSGPWRLVHCIAGGVPVSFGR